MKMGFIKSKNFTIVSLFTVLSLSILALNTQLAQNAVKSLRNTFASENSETLAATATPMSQRHPAAGIWMPYPDVNKLSSYPYFDEVKGVMAYEMWNNIWTSNGSFTWTGLDYKLNKIINEADKKTFLDVTAGYANLPIPSYLVGRIAQRKTPNGHGGYPLQFWDPLYMDEPSPGNFSGFYWDYIKAMAEHIARFDSTDERPTTTDIPFVRAMMMASDMENLPNDSDIDNGLWNYDQFNPSTVTGRRHNVNLTKPLKQKYYLMVSRAYAKALKEAYEDVGLPPAKAAVKNFSHWKPDPETDILANEGNILWVTNSRANPTGSWHFGFVPKVKSGITRGHTESYNNLSDTSMLALWTYWEVVANVHAGIEFIGIYGKNRAIPTIQPYGPIGYLEAREGLKLGNKYAGEERSPSTAPGAFIALRGWYPEKKFSGIEHESIWGDYNILMTHYEPNKSIALYGKDSTDTSWSNVNPRVERTQRQTAGSDEWDSEVSICNAEYGVTECQLIHQQPTVYKGMVGSKHVYSFPDSDLGNVQFCGADMFCTNGGQVTKTEEMIWARRTDKAAGNNYMRFHLNDAYAGSLGGRARIRVAYLDRGTDKWQLIRDNNVVVGTITKTNSNIWKEAFFDITNASFNNSGPGGTDLALYNNDDSDDTFHIIEVLRTGATVNPSPTPTGFQAPTLIPSAGVSSPTPTRAATPTVTQTGSLTINPTTCLNGPTSSGAINLSWSIPNVALIQFSTTSNFTPTSYRKTSGLNAVSSTSAPNGFTVYSGSTNTGTPFIFQPNTTYYVRAYNGSFTSAQTVSIPSCPTSTPTQVPTAIPTNTPSPTQTPTPTATPTPVNIPPQISIISPQNNQTFVLPSQFLIEANAIDSDGTIERVEFYKNDALIHTEFNAPYTHISAQTSPANAYIKVKAYDNRGGEAEDLALIHFVLPTATPTPVIQAATLNLSPITCLAGPTSTGNALTVSWTNPAGGRAIELIQIGTQAGYSTSYRKSNLASVSSTSVPAGFTQYEGRTNTGTPFVMQPNTTYLVRAYNGGYTQDYTFSIPACPTATPTRVPTATPTPANSVIRIYAAGTQSNNTYPTMNVYIKGAFIRSFTNIRGNAANRTFNVFELTYPGKVNASEVVLGFMNDTKNSTGDRNLRIDRIVINGVNHQAEHIDTYRRNMTTSTASTCASGYLGTEWLYCNGRFYFENR